jgi:hypothetical protein
MKPQARGHVEENPQVPVTSDMSRDSGTSTTGDSARPRECARLNGGSRTTPQAPRVDPLRSASQPGGAEQPVLVPLLRWSSLHRSHCLRCSGRLADSCPRQGETLSLAVSCCWRQSQRAGRGSRAPVSEPARSGEPGPAAAGLSGSRTARTVPARPAPAGEPFRLVEPQLV